MSEVSKNLLTYGFDQIEAADEDLTNLCHMLELAMQGPDTPIDRERANGVMGLTSGIISNVRVMLDEACQAIQTAIARAGVDGQEIGG